MTHIVASLCEATYERKQILDYTLGDPTIDLYSGFSVMDDKLSLSEWPIYGSACLGVLDLNGKSELYNNGPTAWTDPIDHTKAGFRQYEISNHLGNVLATISDVKAGIDNPVDGTIDFYEPRLLSRQDYYPFGMIMPGRNDAKKEYRFGFNGKENDNEVKGKGNQQDYGFRIYDTRLGKFLSVDPLTKDYPWYTPYQFAGNMPIWAVDLDGKEEFKQTDFKNTNGELYATIIEVISSSGMKNDGGKFDKQTIHHYEVQFQNDGSYIKMKCETTEGYTTGDDNAFDNDYQRQKILKRDKNGEPIKFQLDKPRLFDSKNDNDKLPDDLITQWSTVFVKDKNRETVATRHNIEYNDEDVIKNVENTYNVKVILDNSTDPTIFSPNVPNVANPYPD